MKENKDGNTIRQYRRSAESKKKRNTWSQLEKIKLNRFVRIKKHYLQDHFKKMMKKNVWQNRVGFIEQMANFIGTRDMRQCLSKFQKEELRLFEELNVFTEEQLDRYIDFKENKNKTKKQRRESEKRIASHFFKSHEESFVIQKITNHEGLKDAINKSIVPFINARLQDCVNNILKQIQLDKEACALKESQKTTDEKFQEYLGLDGVSIDNTLNDISYNLGSS